jgi:hypothetical protein
MFRALLVLNDCWLVPTSCRPYTVVLVVYAWRLSLSPSGLVWCYRRTLSDRARRELTRTPVGIAVLSEVTLLYVRAVSPYSSFREVAACSDAPTVSLTHI